MIIVINKDDPGLLNIANQAAMNDPYTFGSVYQVTDKNAAVSIERLGADEHLFLIGHGAMRGDENNPVIGDESGDLYFLGPEVTDRILSRIIPENYRGSIYVDACESADFMSNSMTEEDDAAEFALSEKIQNTVQALRGGGNVRVYGRAGAASGSIRPPGDAEWIQAGADMDLDLARLRAEQEEREQNEREEREQKEREEREQKEREEHEREREREREHNHMKGRR